MLKVAIGIPTYRDFERISNLLASIFMFTPTDIDFKIVCLDDGTPDKEKVEGLREVCKSYGVPLIENEKNMGIPYSWNRLTEYYDDTDIQVLFNDDICVNDSNWLKSVVYFFENNKDIGSVGWNLIQIDHTTGSADSRYSQPNYDIPAGRVGSPVGCSFAFTRKHWKEIINPDGSIGFCEMLRSFYEETWFGFAQAEKGWLSYHVPYPAHEHWGSQTFSKNAELSTTEFNEYMSKEEYIEIMKKHPGGSSISIEQHIGLADEKGLAYRMDLSRAIFAKYWKAKDYWNVPQVEVHAKLEINERPTRMIKYLDKDMIEREVEA